MGTSGNLMETSWEPHGNLLKAGPSQGPARTGCGVRQFRLWDPELPLYSTPLGSPTDLLKLPYVHVPEVPRSGAGHATSVYARPRPLPAAWLGGYTGWVYRVGNTQAHPPRHQAARAEP